MLNRSEFASVRARTPNVSLSRTPDDMPASELDLAAKALETRLPADALAALAPVRARLGAIMEAHSRALTRTLLLVFGRRRPALPRLRLRRLLRSAPRARRVRTRSGSRGDPGRPSDDPDRADRPRAAR